MEGSYQSGGGAPTHMMGYFQGLPNYNVQQGQMMTAPQMNNNKPRSGNSVSIWVGDLDSYMDEAFLRNAVTVCGWGPDITRIKVVRDHSSGVHAGYGFFDAASLEAAQRLITLGSGMPIPGTNRCWRLNMGRNSQMNNESSSTLGNESNVYVGNLELTVTDYQLMAVFRPRYASVRHAKVVCNEYGQSRGFGFIRFGNPMDAERAVSEMQGYAFNQKPIKLSPANGRSRHFNTGPNNNAPNNANISTNANNNGSGNGATPTAAAAMNNMNGGVAMSGGPQGYAMNGQQQQQQPQQMRANGAGLNNNQQNQNRNANPSTSTNKRPRQLMSPDDPNNTTIFIGGTAAHITQDLLWREFSSFGDVEAVRVPVNKTGFAFVRFRFRESAQRAIEEVSRTHYVSLNPVKPVRVEWASEQISAHPQSQPQPQHTGSYSFDVNAANTFEGGVRPVGYNDLTNNGGVGDNADSAAVAAAATADEGVTTASGAANDAAIANGLVVRPGVKSETGADDGANDGQEVGASSATGAPAVSVGTESMPGAQNVSDTINSENERPSKRVAVERARYSSVPDSVDRAGTKLKATDLGTAAAAADEKDKGSPEEAPAMQFSWLNASTAQGSDNE